MRVARGEQFTTPVSNDGSGTMRAIVRREYGTPDVLSCEEIERPVPGDDDVLVRVFAAGVSIGDHHVVTGKPYLLRLSPFGGLPRPKNRVPGGDMAGVVDAVGANVTTFQPGDEVYGEAMSGAWAEYVAVPAVRVAPKPAKPLAEGDEPEEEDPVADGEGADPEYKPFLDHGEHLAALKRGDVALFAIDGTDQTRVPAGKVIGRVGNFGDEQGEDGVLHVEIIADGRWRQIVDLLGIHSEFWFELEADTDDNLMVDTEDLTRMILPEGSTSKDSRSLRSMSWNTVCSSW